MWLDDLISYIRSFFRRNQKKTECINVDEYETMHLFEFGDKDL
jgi:hypothetical protein